MPPDFSKFKIDRSKDPGATNKFEELLALMSLGSIEEQKYREFQERGGNPYIKVHEGSTVAHNEKSTNPGYVPITNYTYTDRDQFGPPDTMLLFEDLKIPTGERYPLERQYLDEITHGIMFNAPEVERFKMNTQKQIDNMLYGLKSTYGFELKNIDGELYIMGKGNDRKDYYQYPFPNEDIPREGDKYFPGLVDEKKQWIKYIPGGGQALPGEFEAHSVVGGGLDSEIEYEHERVLYDKFNYGPLYQE